MMLFNVKSVREYLLKYGHVYTVRRATRKAGKDTAFYGNRFKNDLRRIGSIEVFIELRLLSPMQLEPYIKHSGMPSSGEWFILCRHMYKREPMNLYHVFLSNHPRWTKGIVEIEC